MSIIYRWKALGENYPFFEVLICAAIDGKELFKYFSK